MSLRYFPGGPLALRHVNFHVQSCEKVRPIGWGRGVPKRMAHAVPPQTQPCELMPTRWATGTPHCVRHAS